MHSGHIITFSDLPRDNPHLVALSLTSLAVGHDFILQCSISTLGNPPLSWFWTCGQKNISHGRMSVFNMSSSKIVFEAEAWQNKMSCFCTAVSSKYNFRALSNEVKITVYCKWKYFFTDVLITIISLLYLSILYKYR